MGILIISYLAGIAAVKLLVCILKYFDFIEYLPTILAWMVFFIIYVIRFFFFFTPREILIENINEKCEKSYTQM